MAEQEHPSPEELMARPGPEGDATRAYFADVLTPEENASLPEEQEPWRAQFTLSGPTQKEVWQGRGPSALWIGVVRDEETALLLVNARETAAELKALREETVQYALESVRRIEALKAEVIQAHAAISQAQPKPEEE